MWRRYLIPLAIVCAAVFLMGSLPLEAAAQHRGQPYASTGMHPAQPDELMALFSRSEVPVRLYAVDGPDSLAIGEEGLFTATANIEVASFPLRFEWNFGDGRLANSLHARHRFTAPGTHMVTFSLSNRHSSASDTLFVTVVPDETEALVHNLPSSDHRMVTLARVDLHRAGDRVEGLLAFVLQGIRSAITALAA